MFLWIYLQVYVTSQIQTFSTGTHTHTHSTVICLLLSLLFVGKEHADTLLMKSSNLRACPEFRFLFRKLWKFHFKLFILRHQQQVCAAKLSAVTLPTLIPGRRYGKVPDAGELTWEASCEKMASKVKVFGAEAEDRLWADVSHSVSCFFLPSTFRKDMDSEDSSWTEQIRTMTLTWGQTGSMKHREDCCVHQVSGWTMELHHETLN